MEIFAMAGGLFALLTFVHFFADWIFQSQHEATNKHNNFVIRARHCTIYTAAFVPVLVVMGVSGTVLLTSMIVLFVSHFIIDTYIPVFLWARYLRKIPDLQKEKLEHNKENVSYSYNAKEVFAQLWSKPVFPILFIAVDQIFHLTFLWPVVLLILFL